MAKLIHSSWVLALVVVVFIAMQGRARSMDLCNMEASQLTQCLPAVKAPPALPTKGCCDVMRHANFTCLCGYKTLLPQLGIDTDLAMALPKKCNINPPPPPCVKK